MSSLKSMPVGFRFHPTDVEVVNHYLKLKNQGSDRNVSNIQEIDVCKWEPWELPGHLASESDDQEWYFFGRRDSKYGKSTRANRATKDGYWKPTGKDRYIKMGSKKVIGTKKTLVFYKGRSQKAVRTHWIMHEYRASVDNHNPQAFVLYLLKKKSDENPDLPISDGADPNRSSPSASLVNIAPSHFPSTPTVLHGSANFSSSDQSRLNQNWKEQEVSSHDQNYAFDSAFMEDDIDLQAFESCFDGQPPTWEGLERMLPPIPLSNIYPNQGPIHTTAHYLNVLNNDHAVTEFQNMMRRKEIVNSIDSGSSIFMETPETVSLDSESGTETDNDVPQSLFGKDALHGGSAYHSDSESSDQEFYNDMILAHEVSLSVNSGIVQRVELDAEGPKKPITSGAHGTAATNLRTRSYSQVPAQASGKKEYGNVTPKTSESKILNAVSDDSSVESLSEAKSFRIAGNESSGRLGGNSHNIGFIVYADNPRVNNGTTPPSNYIMNIAIGIFLTVVITGEVLFGLVS